MIATASASRRSGHDPVRAAVSRSAVSRSARAGSGDGPDAVAAVVQRLAVLLSAGVPPPAAWGYLDAGPAVSAVTDAVARGASVVDAIDGAGSAGSAGSAGFAGSAGSAGSAGPAGAAWRALAAAWAVATEAGAPLATALRDFATSLRSLAQAEREIQVALAGPIATARLVMALPAVAVLFGLSLGFNTLEVLMTTPMGIGCLLAGLGLMAAGRAWNRRLVKSATPTDPAPGLLFDLVAIALAGGAPLDRARDAAVSAAAARGITGDETAIDRVLELSRRAGVPAGELLRSEAEELRRTARSDAQQRAASLSVKLMLPLGACVLPAFMLLGVAPLMLSVISSTVLSF
jgi:tight adherence protein B